MNVEFDTGRNFLYYIINHYRCSSFFIITVYYLCSLSVFIIIVHYSVHYKCSLSSFLIIVSLLSKSNTLPAEHFTVTNINTEMNIGGFNANIGSIRTFNPYLSSAIWITYHYTFTTLSVFRSLSPTIITTTTLTATCQPAEQKLCLSLLSWISSFTSIHMTNKPTHTQHTFIVFQWRIYVYSSTI